MPVVVRRQGGDMPVVKRQSDVRGFLASSLAGGLGSPPASLFSDAHTGIKLRPLLVPPSPTTGASSHPVHLHPDWILQAPFRKLLSTEGFFWEFPGGLVLKDPALSLLWLRSLPQCGFNPWLRKFRMPWQGQKKKKVPFGCGSGPLTWQEAGSPEVCPFPLCCLQPPSWAGGRWISIHSLPLSLSHTHTGIESCFCSSLAV